MWNVAESELRPELSFPSRPPLYSNSSSSSFQLEPRRLETVHLLLI